MARPGTVQAPVLQVPLELQIELVARGLLEAHRLGRVELDSKAQHEVVEICRGHDHMIDVKFKYSGMHETVTSDLVGDGLFEVEPFALLPVVDETQPEVVLLEDVELLTHVVEQILGLASRL